MPQPEEKNDVIGTAEAGEPPKTAKQLEKERLKAEKLAKLQAKLDKKAAAAPAAGEKKEKPEVRDRNPFSRSLGRCSTIEVMWHSERE